MEELMNLEKTSQIIQIAAITLIFLGGMLQAAKILVDKKVKTRKAAIELEEKQQAQEKFDQLDSTIQDQENKIEEKDKEIEELIARTSSISSIELRVYIDEITSKKKLTEIVTSAGIQSAVAFFNKKDERFRFVTDFQFSHQQISDNIHRGTLVFKPEDPNQILGQNIKILQSFKAFVYNFKDFTQYFGFDKNNKTNLLSLVLFVNGIELINIQNIPHENGKLYEGQLSIPVEQLFTDVETTYQQKINENQEGI